MRFAGQMNIDPVQAFLESYQRVPSFGVNPKQKELRYAFPSQTTEQFYQDINNPLKQPAVDKYIFNRHVLDADNPFPIT